MRDAFLNRPTKVAHVVTILWRRKWFLALPLLLAPLVAYAMSARQKPLYRASADVFLETASVVSAVANVSDPTGGDPARYLANQVSVARSSELAQRAVAAVTSPKVSPGTLLAESSVAPKGDADVLSFAVTDASPHRAVVLANAYAREFTSYKTELDTARINAALRVLRARFAWIQGHPRLSFPLSYGRLLEQQSQLETLGKLLADSATVVKAATDAQQVQPRTKQNVLHAIGLGVLLALTFAFLAEAFDRRVRSEQEIDDALGIPVLARVPASSRRLRRADELVMLAEPAGLDAEIFRMLRTNIEYASMGESVRTIMVTSAMQREGKSTTVANIAVAFARAQRRVAIVDLDLRNPSLARLFRLDAVPGVTEVAMRQATVAESVRDVAVTPLSRPYAPPEASMMAASEDQESHPELRRILSVVPSGMVPASPAEIVESDGVAGLLEQLRDEHDFVLIDAPPLPAFSDAMALAGRVDAIIAVARVGVLARAPLEDFARALHGAGAKRLGLVLCGVKGRGGYYEAYRYLMQAETGRAEQARS
jgi:polysaccharide biosynthesis transport protein